MKILMRFLKQLPEKTGSFPIVPYDRIRETDVHALDVGTLMIVQANFDILRAALHHKCGQMTEKALPDALCVCAVLP